MMDTTPDNMAQRWLREAEAHGNDEDVDDVLLAFVAAWAERRGMTGDRRVVIVRAKLDEIAQAAERKRNAR